jgi:hypothetical protein
MSDPTSRHDDDTRPLGDELFDDRTPEDPAPEPTESAPTAVLDVDPQPAASYDPPPVLGRPSPSAPSAPAATPAVPAEATVPAPRRGPRISTIVWGFVIVAFGTVVLASAFGARVDTGLVAILVLAAAGVTLVVGSIISGARRRRG